MYLIVHPIAPHNTIYKYISLNWSSFKTRPTRNTKYQMALSLNESKHRVLKFRNERVGETNERKEKDTFWNEFFYRIGMTRWYLATFEEW